MLSQQTCVLACWRSSMSLQVLPCVEICNCQVQGPQRSGVMQKADVLAFTALVEGKLEPTTAYTTWCEKQSYASHTRAVYGAGLPLPLNYWLPWSQRRAALQRFSKSTGPQVCPALHYCLLAACFAGKVEGLQVLVWSADEQLFRADRSTNTLPHLF